MRLIALLVLIFGASLSAGAMYYASLYMDRPEVAAAQGQQQAGPELVSVIVAKQQLTYGTPIRPNDHLRWAKFPKDSLPEGAFTKAEDLLGKQLEGGAWSETRYVLRQMEVGEPILEAKITGFGESQRMAMRLEEGRRAVAIRIDAVTGVAGFVAPGDRVDVLMTRKSGRDGGIESVVILENIRIIAVDQKTNEQSNNPTLGSTATVDVTAEEAQKLALAQQLGRLHLSLRAQGDDVVENPASERPRTVDVRDLLGEEEEAPRPTGTSVIIRKGGAISDSVTFR